MSPVTPTASASDSKAFDPSGTPQELAEIGISPAIYRSCSPQTQGANAGCQWWSRCDFIYKGLHQFDEEGNQIGGPHNHGIYYVAPSGNQLQLVLSCFQFWQGVVDVRQSGGVYEVVADEGEEILIKGTKAVPVNPLQPAGRQRAESFVRNELVPTFARPKDVFHDKVYEMKVRQAIKTREDRKRRTAAIGYQQAAAAATQTVPAPEAPVVAPPDVMGDKKKGGK